MGHLISVLSELPPHRFPQRPSRSVKHAYHPKAQIELQDNKGNYPRYRNHNEGATNTQEPLGETNCQASNKQQGNGCWFQD